MKQDEIVRKKLEAERAQKTHVIKFTDKSRIIVKSVLNDKVTAELLVDTGATNVLLASYVADRLGKVNKVTESKVQVGQVRGTAGEGDLIMLDSVEVAGARAENVEAIVLDDVNIPGADGLLGMTYLSKFDMRIDTVSGELVLKDKQ